MNTVNHLPQGWEYKKMPEVVKWGSGGTPKATENLYYENGTIPWLIIGDLNDGIVKTSATKITKLGLENSSAKLIPCGTLLIAMYGSIGKLGITGFECCTNQAIAFAQKLNGVDTMYLFYYLMMIKPKLVQMGKGGTQKNISQTVLNSLYIPLPPLATQRAIVSRIETLFAELDKAVQHLRTAQQQLKTYRQAVLNHWLNNDDGKWEMVKLGEVTSKIGSGSTPRGGQSGYKQNGIPLIRSMNIYSEYIKYEGLAFIDDIQAKQLDNVIVHKGDLLLNITGASIGRVNIAPDKWENARVNQHVCIIRLMDDYEPKFIQKYLASPVIQHWIANENYGETRQALSMTMIRNLKVPQMPLAEQQRIVKEIESRLSQATASETYIENALQQAEALRQSILKKAFSGELV
ncbi:MAG: restriction endonuclease subunit S [Bacteroidales bacterium]|nr:restriction endonuclease subunit S [Bacteroidales bacterium]